MADLFPQQDRKIIVYSMLSVLFVTIIVSLQYAKPVLVPLLFAYIIYVFIDPVLRLMEKWKPPIWLNMFLQILVLSLFFGIIVLILLYSANLMITEGKRYEKVLIQSLDSALNFISGFGIEIGKKNILAAMKELPLVNIFQKITGNVMSFATNTGLVYIFAVFMILNRNTTRINKPLFVEIRSTVAGYIETKMLTSLATSVCVGVIFWAIGSNLAFVFAILTFMLNFIPSIGSIIATIVPIPFLWINYGISPQFFSGIILPMIVQLGIGNFIEPKLLGNSMDLHPLTILVFLIFWGLVWGVPGMFMAVPITTIAKYIMSKFNRTKPFSEILAGRFHYEQEAKA